MIQVGPIQSYLNLKIGLPPVLKAGSSGMFMGKKKEINKINLVKNKPFNTI
jgi:hypothetical protein